MARLFAQIARTERLVHEPSSWMAFLGLVTAIAAFAVPGPASDTTGVASILALAGVAVLAGHAWGTLIVAAADVVLLGKLWPLLAFGATDPITTGAAAVAVVTALPGLVLFAATLPHLVDVILGASRHPLRATGIFVGSAGAAAWLLVPAVLAVG
jgi:hypothetical protein